MIFCSIRALQTQWCVNNKDEIQKEIQLWEKKRIFIFQLSLRDNKIGMFCIRLTVDGFELLVFFEWRILEMTVALCWDLNLSTGYNLLQAGISVLLMALFESHLNGMSVKDFRTQ